MLDQRMCLATQVLPVDGYWAGFMKRTKDYNIICNNCITAKIVAKYAGNYTDFVNWFMP